MRMDARKDLSVALLVALVVASAVAGVAQEEEQPTIVIEEMRHDLGDIYEQKTYRHSFKVKNTGSADLVIKQVKPG